MSNILKQLQDKEGELESRLVRKPEDQESKETGESLETTENEATNQGNDDNLQTSTDNPVVETTEETQDDPAEKLTALDKRFRNYKASTDKTIYTLRQERKGILSDLADALEEVEGLKSKLEKMEVQNFDSPFTEEDEKAVGPEAMEIFKKTLRASMEQTNKKELDRQKKERKERIDAVKLRTQEPDESPLDRFARELELLVPDWKSYLSNPSFKEFLDTEDARGITWRKRWLSAEKAMAPELLMDIFDAYEKPRKRLKNNSLDESGSPSNYKSPDAKDKKAWTPKEIADFHSKQQSGYYRKSRELMKEGQRIEAEIDAYVKTQFGG